MLRVKNPNVVPPGRWRYHQQETDWDSGTFGTFRELVLAVREHRQSNNLPIGTDFEAELQNWFCMQLAEPTEHCTDRFAPSPITTSINKSGGWNGAYKWDELHNYALRWNGDKAALIKWMRHYTETLPCGDCKAEWKRIQNSMPFTDVENAEMLFLWTVTAHNRVNKKLGYKIWTLDEAHARWASQNQPTEGTPTFQF
jgi:hypothetical protein